MANLVNKLKILTWNANGVRHKTNELEHLINEQDIDIVFVQESKLNKISPTKINNYDIINKPNGQIYGLLIYIKRNISYSEVTKLTHSYENCGIKINNTTIFNAYISPNLNINTQDLDTMLNSDSKVMIIGDHNAKHQNWNNHKSNKNGRIITNYISNTNYTLAYPENSYTHYPDNGNLPSTIDFALVKNCNISDVYTTDDLNSDHIPIIFELKLNNQIEIINKFVSNTNWRLFRQQLEQKVKINNLLETKQQIDIEIQKFTETIKHCFEASTTHKVIKYLNILLPAKVLIMIKYKNILRRRFQRLRDTSIKNEINLQTKQINLEINSIKTKNWEETMRKITPKNPKNLWRIAKALKRNTTTTKIPAMQSESGLVFTDEEKANTIAKSYHKIHKQTENMSDAETIGEIEKTIQSFYKLHIHTPNTHLTSVGEIKSIIKNLNTKKAPGDDEISNNLIKNFTQKAVVQVYYILNNCLKLQYFPNRWKNAVVIPFIKPTKNPAHPTSYRPISLLPHMGKILETLIHNRLKSH